MEYLSHSRSLHLEKLWECDPHTSRTRPVCRDVEEFYSGEKIETQVSIEAISTLPIVSNIVLLNETRYKTM